MLLNMRHMDVPREAEAGEKLHRRGKDFRRQKETSVFQDVLNPMS